MDQALAVGGGETRADSGGQLGGLGGRQASDACEQGGDVFAIHELHRNVELPIDFTDIVNAANMRMRDLARGPHLVEKPFARLDLVRGGCREELEGDGLTEHKVGRAIDLAHASAAQ